VGYTHLEVDSRQTPKTAGPPCGDVFVCERTAHAATVALADGIGAGVKANIAATLCVSRLMELLRAGFSLREAFGRVVETMNRSRSPDLPYAAFTVARVLDSGQATILSYDMPPPLLVTARSASILGQQVYTRETAVLGESQAEIAAGEGILLVSDGITQAGLGAGLADGWTIEGVQDYVQTLLHRGTPLEHLPRLVHDQAVTLWRRPGDDCTALLLRSRPGKSLTVFTGPPSQPDRDAEAVERFQQADGWKVACGATTTAIIARHLGRQPVIDPDPQSMIAPPRYRLEGLDLATEGAVTLNQVYNVIDEDPAELEQDSPVTEFCWLLHAADRIHFLVGSAVNPANKDISFRQLGILSRGKIVLLLADKLRQAGKLVLVEYV